jgi:hypothetical protein
VPEFAFFHLRNRKTTSPEATTATIAHPIIDLHTKKIPNKKKVGSKPDLHGAPLWCFRQGSHAPQTAPITIGRNNSIFNHSGQFSPAG